MLMQGVKALRVEWDHLQTQSIQRVANTYADIISFTQTHTYKYLHTYVYFGPVKIKRKKKCVVQQTCIENKDINKQLCV